jgi:hypothetical protein
VRCDLTYRGWQIYINDAKTCKTARARPLQPQGGAALAHNLADKPHPGAHPGVVSSSPGSICGLGWAWRSLFTSPRYHSSATERIAILQQRHLAASFFLTLQIIASFALVCLASESFGPPAVVGKVGRNGCERHGSSLIGEAGFSLGVAHEYSSMIVARFKTENRLLGCTQTFYTYSTLRRPKEQEQIKLVIAVNGVV